MNNIPPWAKESRDNTKYKRKAALFTLLQEMASKLIHGDDYRFDFVIAVDSLKEALIIT